MFKFSNRHRGLLAGMISGSAAMGQIPDIVWFQAGDGSVAFSQNSQFVAHGLPVVTLRQAANGVVIRDYPFAANGAIGFSPDSALLAAGTTGVDMHLFFTAILSIMQIPNSCCVVDGNVHFSPDSNSVFAVASGDIARRYNASNGTVFGTYGPTAEPRYAIALAPGGGTLALSSGFTGDTGHIRFVNTANGVATGPTISFQLDNNIVDLEYSPSGQRVVMAQNGQLREYNTTTGAQTLVNSPMHQINDMAYTPDGAYLIVVGLDDPFDGPFGKVIFIRTSNNSIAQTYTYQNEISRVAVSGDGQRYVFNARNQSAHTIVVARNPFASTPCVGDLDHDGVVGLSDLARLLANFGRTSGATADMGDLDADADVDLQDLALMLARFGQLC